MLNTHDDGNRTMAARRQIIAITITDDEPARLEAVSRSRTESACRVERARIVLAYRANPSTYAVGEAPQALG